jgi:hypothetical protein
MGKRSRKRATGPVRAPEVAPAPRPAERRRPGQSRVDRFIEKADARPKPPWHPVPLVELSVLTGIVLLVVGIINRDDRQGRLAVIFGLVLASLGGLDTAVRDHFGGFRSHSALLAAFPAVATALLIALVHPVPYLLVIGAIVAFAAAFWWFRRAFKKRAGVGFKV